MSKNGEINFPSIGVIKVTGLTIKKLRKLINDKLKNEGILLDPYVDVKILNSFFTILGEVNRPGRYDFLENNLNIFEALGMAGDLTINGKRSGIKIIRNSDGANKISEFSLTDYDILKSEFFQIYSGDIIIVSPNTTRVKNAGIIGNSGTLLSLLSFILSSIIVIQSTK